MTLDLVGVHFLFAEKTPKISLISHRSTSQAAALGKVIMTIAKVAHFAVEQVSLQAISYYAWFSVVLRSFAKILWSATSFSQLGRVFQCLACFVTPMQKYTYRLRAGADVPNSVDGHA